MGGVFFDEFGRIIVENFFVCGEAVGICVYGVNRFVLNLFLEGFVFGRRIV